MLDSNTRDKRETPSRAAFECNLEAFANALATVGLVVIQKPRIAHRGGVLLDADADGIVLTATDMQSVISVRVPVCGASGHLLLDHAELVKLLAAAGKGLPKRQRARLWASIHETGPLLPVITVSGFELPVAAYAPVDFPETLVAPPPVAVMKREDFVGAVGRVVKAAGQDSRLEEFYGVKLDVREGQVILTATDRLRLATAPLPAETFDVGGSADGALLSTDLLAKFARRLHGEFITIGWNPRKSGAVVSLTCGDLKLVTQSLTTKFAPYERALSAIPIGMIVVDRDELLAATERSLAMAAAKGETREQVELRIGKSDLSVVPVLATHENMVKGPTIAAKVEGFTPDERVRTNAEHLSEGLRTFDAPRVALHIGGVTKPIVITDAGRESGDATAYRYLVMRHLQPEQSHEA